MAYPPPDDVPGVDGLRYFIVAIPDDEKYVQAAMGAYTEMASRWFWGKEVRDPDADIIAQHWYEAIAETLEAWEMGGFETLIGHIDEIEGLLRSRELQECCDNPAISFLGTEQIPDAGYGYEDTYPSTWGDGETIASQADYDEVLCAMAHRFVDYLTTVGPQYDAAIVDGLAGISILAGIMAEISGLGFILVGAYAALVAIVTAIAAGWTSDLFTDAGTAIESARDEVVCAFLSGNATTLEYVVEGEISALAYSLMFTHFDYESAINAAQTGTWKGEYLEIERNDTCDCAFEHDVTFDFNLSGEGFIFGSRTDWSDPDNLIRAHPVDGASPEPTATDCSRTNLGTKAGIGNVPMFIELMTLDVLQGDIGDYFALGKEVEVTVRYEDTTFDRTVILAYGSTINITVNPAKEIEAGAPQWLNIRHQAKGSSTQGNIFMDNIRVGFHE